MELKATILDSILLYHVPWKRAKMDVSVHQNSVYSSYYSSWFINKGSRLSRKLRSGGKLKRLEKGFKDKFRQGQMVSLRDWVSPLISKTLEWIDELRSEIEKAWEPDFLQCVDFHILQSLSQMGRKVKEFWMTIWPPE